MSTTGRSVSFIDNTSPQENIGICPTCKFTPPSKYSWSWNDVRPALRALFRPLNTSSSAARSWQIICTIYLALVKNCLLLTRTQCLHTKLGPLISTLSGIPFCPSNNWLESRDESFFSSLTWTWGICDWFRRVGKAAWSWLISVRVPMFSNLLSLR